ncbi:MAG: zinc-binding dehydrogenase [bacterium]|nr:zinc-binding dehydrogenase [bacterium]
MRAVVLKSQGPAENLQPASIPVPELIPGHALLRVHATSLNPVDVKIRQGLPIVSEDPAVLHGDVAGTIEALAPDVTATHPEGLRPGDAVYGCCGGVRGSGGALAEFMLVDARLLAKMPAGFDFAQAAALPLVTITAWEALFDRGGLREPDTAAGATSADRPEANDEPGQQADKARTERILIQGGAGGVGHVAVQLARAAGFESDRLFATASTPHKQRFVAELGATPIAYENESVESYVQRCTGGAGFDLVFDTVGGESLDASFAAVKRGGRVCAIAARSTHDLSPLHSKGASLHVIFMLQPLLFDDDTGRERHGEILRAAARLATAGLLRPCIDARRFMFSQAADAHRHYENGDAVGKIVLENDL